MRPCALLALFLLSNLAVLLPKAGADTALHYFSESGDYIGQGQERTLTPAGGYTFQVTATASSVGFVINGTSTTTSQFYSLGLSAPTGSNLAVTSYPGATRDAFRAAGEPGLDFSGEGRGSNTLTGEFTVLEITFGTDGSLATFAADFAQHSEGAAPACYGEIRYNSSVPYDVPSGLAQLSANNYRVSATAGSLTVTATRLNGSTGAISATYSTADGTDLAGRDYVATSGTVSWADGDAASKTFTIPILNSGNPTQGDGTFFVNLSGPYTGPQTQATVTVVNDNSSVTFLHFVSESGDYIGQGQERTFSIANQFVLTPSRNYDGGVSFSFSDSTYVDFQNAEYGSLDFAAATGTIFGVGDFEDAQRFPFQTGTHPGLDFDFDSRGSNTVTGNFQVLEAQFDDNGNVLKFAANFVQHSEGGVPALTGQVRYNSTVPVPVTPGTEEFSTVAYSVSETAGTATITVNRVGGSGGAASVGYATSDGTAVAGVNYTPTTGTLAWADGDATPKTFTVPVLDDGVVTGGLSVNLRLTGDTLGTPAQATLTITNKDTAQVQLAQFSSASYTANETDGTATIAVDRVGGNKGTLSVNYATSDGTAVAGVNYTPTSGTLTWADGDATPKTFTVPVLDDGIYTASLTVGLRLTGTAVGTPAQATLNLLNADPNTAGTVQFSSATYTANETDSTASITVDRIGGNSGALSIGYATADGTGFAGVNYTPTTGTLTWANGDSTPKTFKVPLLDPVTGLTSQTVLLNLSGTGVGTLSQATLIITNSNFPLGGTVSLSANSYTANETDGTATIVVNRTGGSYGAVSVDYTTVDGTATAGRDYTAISGTLSWVSGDSSPKVFTVPLLDVQAAAGIRTLLIQLTGTNVGTMAQAKLFITDNAVAAVPVVSVAASTPMVGESGGAGVLLVTRVGDTSAALVVSYKVKGAAKPGVDYKALKGTVTIPAGVSKAKVKIKPIDNKTVDGTRVAKIKLVPSTDGSYTLGTAITAKVKIVDND